MPWSPVPKMPAIMKDLYERGYIEQPFPYEILEVSIIKITGLVKQISIKQAAEVMIKLGYLRKKGELFYTAFNPYTNQFKKEKEDDAEKEVDNLLDRMKA